MSDFAEFLLIALISLIWCAIGFVLGYSKGQDQENEIAREPRVIHLQNNSGTLRLVPIDDISCVIYTPPPPDTHDRQIECNWP